MESVGKTLILADSTLENTVVNNDTRLFAQTGAQLANIEALLDSAKQCEDIQGVVLALGVNDLKESQVVV